MNIKDVIKLGLWLLLVFALSANCYAETIKGSVKDVNGHPMPYVTISVLDKDSVLLTGDITDEQGNALLNDESGAKMVPDAILHYPNNEDVVIDAKMSIDAYAKYVETEDETQRKQLAKEVVRSIREQFRMRERCSWH